MCQLSARTEDEIRQSLIDRGDYTNFISSTEFQERGRLDIQYSCLGAEISEFERDIEEITNESDLIKATDYQNVVNLASPFYVASQASKSQVILTFTRDKDVEGDILIPEGTYVENPDINPIQYQTVSDAWLYHGQDTVKVLARSVKAGLDTMVKANTLTVITNNIVENVTVNNAIESWGGRDAEDIASIKRGALSAKYSMEKGNRRAIVKALNDIGIDYWRYNLSEHEFGEGTGAFFLDTNNPEELRDAQLAIEQVVGFGIYRVYQIATPLEFDMTFDIEVSSETDLLPNVRDQLKIDLEEAFRNIVLANGVGQKLVISRVVNELFDALLSKYELTSIEIDTSNYTDRKDEKGNIVLESYEVIKVANVTVNIDAV